MATTKLWVFIMDGPHALYSAQIDAPLPVWLFRDLSGSDGTWTASPMVGNSKRVARYARGPVTGLLGQALSTPVVYYLLP